MFASRRTDRLAMEDPLQGVHAHAGATDFWRPPTPHGLTGVDKTQLPLKYAY